MNREDFIRFDNANVKRLGHYKTFDNANIKKRREQRISKVAPQYLELIEALRNENFNFLCFEVVRRKKKINFITDIVLPDFNILIRFWDKDNEVNASKREAFFKAVRYWAYPFFVEKDDTLDKTLNKLSFCIIEAMANPKMGIKTKLNK